MKTVGMIMLLAAQAFALAPHFEENRGQVHAPGVQFLTRDRGRQVFFTSNEVIWSSNDERPIRLRFLGATSPSQWIAAGARTGDISYFIGNDETKWVNNAGQFERIVWRGVYPGIDAVFYWRGGRLEYDLIAAAGADLTKVHIQWNAPAVRLEPTGAISIAGGEVRQLAPVIYQDKNRIEGSFETVANQPGEFRLKLGDYDRQRPITIDPVIEASVYISGENEDRITVTREGFVAGTTASVRVPGTVPSRRRSRDIFVQGTGRVGIAGTIQFAGTVILGGSGDEEVAGGFYDNFREVILGGTTSSNDLAGSPLPVKGTTDGFVCRLQSDGRFLIPPSCRLVGGSGEDRILSLSGNASSGYVFAGETTSPDLPGAVGSYKGGVDGFFGTGFSPNLYYLGGSGDDRVLAAAITGSIPTHVFLAGETRSQDFANVSPSAASMQGPSDGFLTLATFARTATPLPPPDMSSVLIGGTGDDRLTAVSANISGPRTIFFNETDPIVAVAGTTNSPDLPVREAAQPALAGETDAFLGFWRNGKFEWLTYLGGSGVDEATAVERNWAGDLFVTGWTRSTDLKTVSPVQRDPGGGDDAFYGIVGPGVIKTLTYFGGSGDDRASSLTLVREGTARMGGWSNSADLPAAIDTIQERGQGSDGFYVELGSSYLFSLPRLHLAKDGVISVPLAAAQAGPALPVTFRSSDRSKVRVNDGSVSKEEVIVPLGSLVYFEGLADSGEVDVTATAPGFAPAIIRVQLYPGMAYLPTPVVDFFPGNQSASTALLWFPVDPATSSPLVAIAPSLVSTTPRSGFRLPSVIWSTSNEQVVRPESSQTNVGDANRLAFLGTGEARLRAAIEGVQVWPTDGVTYRVVPPPIIVPQSVTLGMNLQTNLRYTVGSPISFQPLRTALTVQSGDPTKLLIAADASTPGTESLTLSVQQPLPFGVVLQALSSEGEVPVTFRLPEFGAEVVTMVRLEPSRMRWGFQSALGRPAEPVWTTIKGLNQQPVFTFEGISGSPSAGLRPGIAPPVFRFSSSDSNVLELSRITVRPQIDTFTVLAATEGTATLTLSTDGPIPVELVNRSVAVTVNPPPARLDAVPPESLILGKDLQLAVRFRYSQSGAALSVVSEDPSAVAVSAALSQPGVAALSMPLQPSGEYTFYVQALRDSGETAVVVKFPGGESKTRITLLPSGLNISALPSTATGDLGFQVSVAAVDELTGIPLQSQIPGPGKRITAALRTEGASVRVSAASLELTSATPSGNITVTQPPPGQEAKLIAEAGSFNSASVVFRGTRTQMQAPRTASVTEDTITAVRLSSILRTPVPMRISSSNPESVLVSRSASDPGAPSFELNPPSLLAEVYLHGGKPSGPSLVTIQAEGMEPLEITVNVLPLQVAMEFDSIAPFGPITIPADRSVTGSLRLLGGLLSPRAAPIRYALRTSDPAVATVTPAEVIIGASGRSPNFTITGKSPGFAELLAESDRVPSSAFARPIAVRAPNAAPATVENVNLPSNLQQLVNILPLTGNTSGVIATVTSSDPSRVVVSRNDSALGGASANVAVQAGGVGTFFIQSMGVPGQAEITARAPGFPEQRWLVRIVPSWVAAYVDRTSMTVGAQTFASASVTSADPPAPGAQRSLRPDLRPMTFRLTNSDPTIASLSGATITSADGVGSPSVTVRALAEGRTRIGVEQPSGFGPSPNPAPLLTVGRPAIGVNCSSGIVLARDTQLTCFLSVPSGTVVEAVSSDPEKLVISGSSTTQGTGRLTVTATESTLLTLQALAASGTVEVLLSSPGFEPLRVPVVLRRAMIFAEASSSPIPRGAEAQFRLNLYAERLDNQGFRQMTARAGASIQVGVSATPAGIVSFSPASAIFEPGASGVGVRVRGETAGGAVLRLSLPDGIVDGTTVPVAFVVQ